jgi:hypothetical protein
MTDCTSQMSCVRGDGKRATSTRISANGSQDVDERIFRLRLKLSDSVPLRKHMVATTCAILSSTLKQETSTPTTMSTRSMCASSIML